MSDPEVGPAEPLERAIRWLATLPADDRPRPLVPDLQRRFGLTPAEACQAIREATVAHGRAT